MVASRSRLMFFRGSAGAASVEAVAAMVVVSLVVGALLTAFVRASPEVAGEARAAVCRIVDAGGGPECEAGPGADAELVPPATPVAAKVLAKEAGPVTANVVATPDAVCTQPVSGDYGREFGDDVSMGAPHEYWTDTWQCTYPDGSVQVCQQVVRKYDAWGVGTRKGDVECEQTTPPRPVIPPTVLQPDTAVADECGDGVALTPEAYTEAVAANPAPVAPPKPPAGGAPAVPPVAPPAPAQVTEAEFERLVAEFAQVSLQLTQYDVLNQADRLAYIQSVDGMRDMINAQPEPNPYAAEAAVLNAMMPPGPGAADTDQFNRRLPSRGECVAVAVIFFAILGTAGVSFISTQFGILPETAEAARILALSASGVTAAMFIALEMYTRRAARTAAAEGEVRTRNMAVNQSNRLINSYVRQIEQLRAEMVTADEEARRTLQYQVSLLEDDLVDQREQGAEDRAALRQARADLRAARQDQQADMQHVYQVLNTGMGRLDEMELANVRRDRTVEQQAATIAEQQRQIAALEAQVRANTTAPAATPPLVAGQPCTVVAPPAGTAPPATVPPVAAPPLPGNWSEVPSPRRPPVCFGSI